MYEIDKLFIDIEKELRNIYPNSNILVPKPDPKNGKENIDIMFVNERPGRIGTKKSGIISFDNDDPSARNFKELFASLNILREKIFITNACLWFPDNHSYIDVPPTTKMLREEVKWFREQVEILKPKLIVAVGGSALRALRIFFEDSIELRNYTLRNNIGQGIEDTKLPIFPVYHTAIRVRNSGNRTEEEQMEDWRKMRDFFYGICLLSD